MKKIKNSVDYYPVYKDLAEITYNKSAGNNPELMLRDPDKADINGNSGSGTSGSAIMPDAESLVRICRESGFSASQTHIMLLKNLFV